jgi:prevent-host-death family protein
MHRGVMMSTEPVGPTLGVAEAKSRFSELIDRVARGERFVIARRGRPVLALVPPGQALPPTARPTGLAAIAGAVDEWTDLPDTVEDIYRARRTASDRPVPDLD